MSKEQVTKSTDTTLDAQHQELARLVSLGLSHTEVANRLLVSTNWVKTHKQLPEVQCLIQDFKDEALAAARGRVQDLSKTALDTLEDLLDSQFDTVRLGAAKDILDRYGLVKTEHKQIKIVDDFSDVKTDDILNGLRARLAVVQEEESEPEDSNEE